MLTVFAIVVCTVRVVGIVDRDEFIRVQVVEAGVYVVVMMMQMVVQMVVGCAAGVC